MYQIRFRVTPLLASLVLVCLSLVAPTMVRADSPSEGSACRTCHEDLYYCNDIGKWYCMCGEQRTCTGCHRGVDGVWDIEAAHTGLIANPLSDGIAICQDCHPEDAQVYVEKFASIAWIDLHATPAPTQTAYVPVVLAAGEEPSIPALQREPFKPWQKLAIGLFGPAFLGVIIFGYQCWRADCKRSRQAL